MNNLNPRIGRLKRMMALEEKRAQLQQAIDSLLPEMSALKAQLLGKTSDAAARVADPSIGRRPASRKRSIRGGLKEKIMAALEAAGAAGVKVKELAGAIGTKPVNIHSWFHSALKRETPVQKITGGHYRLGGSSAAQASRPTGATWTKVPRGTPKGARRGQLSAQILGALKNAGESGISVAELAARLGAKYKNIYIWFATTGKKQAGVKKLGPARYKLTA